MPRPLVTLVGAHCELALTKSSVSLLGVRPTLRSLIRSFYSKSIP